MALQGNRLVSVNKQTLYSYNFTPVLQSSSKGSRFLPYDEDEEEMTDLAAQPDIEELSESNEGTGDDMMIE